jgi:hypothetical protein
MGQQVTVTIQGNIQWAVTKDPESGAWVGVCPLLNLNAVGDDWLDLQRYINEAMALLFIDLFETGELGAYLVAHGWTADQPLPEPGSRPRFEVPYDLMRTGSTRELLTSMA